MHMLMHMHMHMHRCASTWWRPRRTPCAHAHAHAHAHAQVREHMVAPEEDAVVFMCGPPPMIKFACVPNLEKVGFAPEQLHTF